jgi:O-antigen ligase
MAIAPFVAAAADRGDRAASAPAFGAGAERLATGGSNRIEYWEAAVKALADDPLTGGGAGAFAVAWLEHREIDEVVRDAHSLELETAAELGLLGLLLLGVTIGGVVLASRQVALADPGLAAGPLAALAVWAAHSAIDWDWEVPALTLLAAILAGTLLARSQPPPPPPPAR